MSTSRPLTSCRWMCPLGSLRCMKLDTRAALILTLRTAGRELVTKHRELISAALRYAERGAAGHPISLPNPMCAITSLACVGHERRQLMPQLHGAWLELTPFRSQKAADSSMSRMRYDMPQGEPLS